MQPRILIADDQADVLAALRLLLKREGFDVASTTSPAGVLDVVSREQVDVALVDLNYARDTTSGAEGLDLLDRLRGQDAELPVVVMTAWATVDVAVEAMRRGAQDFIEKPWDNQRLLSVLRNQVELSRARRARQRLASENALLRQHAGGDFIADSPAMDEVVRLARQVAPSTASVLITGEPGTGKSALARLVHEWSDRAAGPFIGVNLGGLAEGVFESELFGHVKGAYTDARADRAGRFEIADGGTLFLDEIGNVPTPQQARLLRALETGEFERVGASRTQRADVRIVSATNADLPALVADGRFREDLLFRINTIEIRMPPLRERTGDILPLASAALASRAARYGRNVTGFEPAAVSALLRYPWPGNVRELNSVVERSLLLAAGPGITVADLRLAPSRNAPPALEEMSLEDAERALIRAALRRHDGNVLEAAEALGLSRSAMYRRLEKLGIKAGPD
ncbi:MAG: sigma-54 dependent transcriptional regulator [Steroidobacteraceae bacterium]|jgi:DNA-binding NtrC family response regulator|nr:sigma-54 dependent transcriptional regulator [Steroidobacteraceae bacterium]